MENEEAIKLKKEISKLEMRIIKYASKYNVQIREKRQKMESVCTHNEIKKVDDYVPGGYYERCEYIHKEICTVCGKVISEKKTFGGFG